MLPGDLSEFFEDVGQVEVLSVDIADDDEGSLQSQHVGFAFCVWQELRRIEEASVMILRMSGSGRLPFSLNSSVISLILYFSWRVFFRVLRYRGLLSGSRFSITNSYFI